MDKKLLDKTDLLQNNIPYILFTIALLLFSFIPFLMGGMSSDGVLYSSFAYNLAHGISTLWSPFLTPAHWSTFHAHPPLSFYFHSLFLSYLGDDSTIDKIYFFSTALVNLILVTLFWRKYHSKLSCYFLWIPVLFWVLILENCLESYRGNIDATLMVFTTLSTYFIFNACSHEKKRLFYSILGSISIIAAFFINGCQAFFLLTVPLIYFTTFHQKKLWTGIKHTALLSLITFIGIILFLYNNEAAWKHMHLYLFDKLFQQSILKESNHFLFSRLLIFWVIVKNLALALLFSITCFFVYSKQGHQPLFFVFKKFLRNRRALFFFLVALSASLPVLITPHQTSRYIAASYPIWTLSFSELLTPLFVNYINQKKFDSKCFFMLRYLGVVCLGLVVALGYFCSGKVLFGKPVLDDIALIKQIIPPKTEVSLDVTTLDEQWSYFLRLNLYRQMQIISYDVLGKSYYLQGKQIQTYPVGYQPVNLHFQTFALYKHIDKN